MKVVTVLLVQDVIGGGGGCGGVPTFLQ